MSINWQEIRDEAEARTWLHNPESDHPLRMVDAKAYKTADALLEALQPLIEEVWPESDDGIPSATAFCHHNEYLWIFARDGFSVRISKLGRVGWAAYAKWNETSIISNGFGTPERALLFAAELLETLGCVRVIVSKRGWE